jgi:hypothetical protein
MISKREKQLIRVVPHIRNGRSAAVIVSHVLNSIINRGSSSTSTPGGSITIKARDMEALYRAVVTMLISTEQAISAFERAASSEAATHKHNP